MKFSVAFNVDRSGGIGDPEGLALHRLSSAVLRHLFKGEPDNRFISYPLPITVTDWDDVDDEIPHESVSPTIVFDSAAIGVMGVPAQMSPSILDILAAVLQKEGMPEAVDGAEVLVDRLITKLKENKIQSFRLTFSPEEHQAPPPPPSVTIYVGALSSGASVQIFSSGPSAINLSTTLDPTADQLQALLATL